jgi:hypothetical protein
MAKIPEHAHKVFEGVIFDVYQWEQEMFDGSKATFEMVKRPYTVEVIPVMIDGTIAIAYEQQPPVPETVSAVDEAYGRMFAPVAVEVMMPAMLRVEFAVIP